VSEERDEAAVSPLESAPSPTRIPFHAPLRRWNPLSEGERRDTRRFIHVLMAFPHVTVATIVLLAWCYFVQLFLEWPFFSFLPVGGELLSELRMEVLGRQLGWLDGRRVFNDAVLAGGDVTAGEYWRLLSSTLLHGSLFHVVANCLVLFMLGRIVENAYGRAPYLIAYVGAGITGALLSALVTGKQSLGASGAVLGMLGVCLAFGYRYRRQIPSSLRDYFNLDMWFFVVLIAAFSALPMVDWAGHLGGFLWGAIVGLLWPARILDGEPGPALRLAGVGASTLCLSLAVVTMAVVATRIPSLDDVWPDRELRALEFAMNRGDLDTQLEIAERLEALFPDEPRIQLILASVLLEARQWATAAEIMRDIESEWPALARSQPYYDNDLAWSLFLAHPDDPRAIDEGLMRVRRNLKKSRDDHAMQNTLAFGLFLDGQLVAAEKEISLAMKGRSRSEREHDVFLHVRILLALGRYEEAVREYLEFVDDFPQGEFREAAESELTALGLLGSP